MERALRRSEASFRMLIERSPDGIAVHRDGRFVYVNPATLEGLGYAGADELVGRPALEIVEPSERATVASRIRAMLESGEPVPAREERFLRKDGTILDVAAIALPLDFDGQPSVVVVARDITERKQLSAKMMQMDRMSAVGTLAAGIGHEINNPLQYVIANLDFLAREIPELLLDAREIESAAANAGMALSARER